MENKNKDIQSIRNQILDRSIVIAAIAGAVAYMVSLFRLLEVEFHSYFIFEFVIVASLIVLAVRREKLSAETKVFTLISIISLLSFSDAIRFGLVSSLRVYLVLIPFFSILVFSLYRTLVICFAVFTVFVGIGFLHHNGILSVPPEFESPSYLYRMYPWIINGLHISVVSLIIFIITHSFLKGYAGFISALHESNTAIKEREQNYREIFNSTSEAILIQEADTGKIVDVNDVMIRMFGYDEKEGILALSVADLSKSDPDYSNEVMRKNVFNAVHHGEQLFEWHARKANGELFWIEVSLKKTEIGGKGSVLAVIRDINERKRLNEILQQNQVLFRKVIEMAPYSMNVKDMQGCFRMVNDSFCKAVGFPAEEIIGKLPSELGIALDPRSQEKVDQALSEYGKIENLEVRVVFDRKDAVDILYSSVVISLNNEQFILSSSVNITERKKIEKELEAHRSNLEQLVKKRTEELSDIMSELSVANEELIATNEELSSANDELFRQKEELRVALDKLKFAQNQLIQAEKLASLGILASGIAHEINNPLNFISAGIVGLENYMREKISGISPEVKPYCDGINEGVRRATAIVNSLGHYNRDGDLPFEPCKIHDIIDNCLVMLQNEIRNRINIKKNYTSFQPAVNGNEGKLHQAFLNLLANAAQAIESSGEIDISTIVGENELQIRISDTGSGIPREVLPRIFDLFFTTKDPGKGSGLGLSITYDIIREHEGTIQIESEEGIGTVVIVMLPLIVLI